MAIKLSLSTLNTLPAQVSVPSYRRDEVSAGIVHIGVGNFHRAHQAVYLDRLFNLGRDHDWAIVGAGVKPYDATMRDALAPQDWLSTIVELDPDELSARVTGAMIDFVDIDSAALIARIADPAIRIVSLTITEGGYYVDAKTGGFNAAHPEIQQDATHPDSPQTAFGIMIAGLMRRRAAGIAPFTIMSCDNLPENGRVARRAVEGLAALISPEAQQWIAGNVAFPNSMVDCITPATSQRERDMVAQRFGIEDAAPVACEPFHQWVLEDNFPQGRPALEHVGVEFVADVAPYELMKLRILNAGHATIAYPSALLGFEYVHEAMADPDIRAWLLYLSRHDIIPILPKIAGVDFDAYLLTCAERFSNPAVGDTIARLCLDGSNRQPKFILPTIAEALDAGAPIEGLALEVALWCRYCAVAAEDPAKIDLVDERAGQLKAAATAARADPAIFLQINDVFGSLAANQRFCDAFADQLERLCSEGPRAAIRNALGAGRKGG